jgi:hypothetical protein
VEHDPRLGLTEVRGIELRCLRVVRVNLDGKRAIAIEELQQQRKVLVSCMPAHKLRAIPLHQLGERSTGKRSSSDDALISVVVDNFPTLGIVVAIADRLAQHGPQPPPAPQIPAENRLKSQQVVKDRRHSEDQPKLRI